MYLVFNSEGVVYYFACLSKNVLRKRNRWQIESPLIYESCFVVAADSIYILHAF